MQTAKIDQRTGHQSFPGFVALFRWRLRIDRFVLKQPDLSHICHQRGLENCHTYGLLEKNSHAPSKGTAAECFLYLVDEES
jgi:hypothetical protein